MSDQTVSALPAAPRGPTQGQATLGLVLLVAFALLSAFCWFNVLRPTWEYKVADLPDDGFTQQANALGARGWEIVSARRATTGDLGSGSATAEYELILKRRVRGLVATGGSDADTGQ